MAYLKSHPLLLPCPFCGGDVEIDEQEEIDEQDELGNITKTHLTGAFYAICQGPDCGMAPAGEPFDSIAEVVEAWNWRNVYSEEILRTETFGERRGEIIARMTELLAAPGALSANLGTILDLIDPLIRKDERARLRKRKRPARKKTRSAPKGR